MTSNRPSELTVPMRWAWQRLERLSSFETHRILRARAEVFVVEQACAYQDCDDLDLDAWHLAAWTTAATRPEIAAYLRVVDPGAKYTEVALGRVLTTKPHRRIGLGRALITEALRRIHETYGPLAVRISAQQYLETFYRSFGFATVSEPYLEDNIPHLEMLRA